MFEWGGTKTATGTVTLSTSASTTVNIGFKPKYLAAIVYKSGSYQVVNVYDSSVDESKYSCGAINSSTSSCIWTSLPYTSSGAAHIASITDTGFTMTKSSTTYGTNCYYFAIG